MFARTVVVFVGILSVCRFEARATDYQLGFDNTFSGTSPSGTAPWMNVVLQNLGGGNVSITISNGGLQGSEFISGLYLNLNTNLNPSSLSFNLTGGNAPGAAAQISTGTDQFKADGDGFYDILLSFPTTGPTRFGAGDVLEYQVSGPPSLTDLDFDYLSAPAGGSGPFLAAAHVQSIGGGASGWINPEVFQPMPEPSAAGLIIGGAALSLVWRRARNSKQVRTTNS